MVPKSDHLANPRFDKKPSAHAQVPQGGDGLLDFQLLCCLH